MGIPRFFKWIAERYPCIITPFNDVTIPAVDNLYLDMNGIIHTCARSDDKTAARPSEKELMLRIFQYIDQLFNLVKPRKYFYMAIDGVAPRAKMNQQRARRFRSALDAQNAEQALLKAGEPVNEDPFDSNCITPGTEFMARLSDHLRYLIRKKMQEDANWQKCKVIFSGHEVPGEGEHKIMWFIRNRKMTEKDYNPNETHCLYGLDADLIMLGLATHEPHFMLLREDVSHQFVRRVDKKHIGDNEPIQKKFQLLFLGILREYLDLEFRDALANLSQESGFEYDLERIVDDFVAMCFLCGNDFLPHMPTLGIREGAIDVLFDIYRNVLPTLDGYLTENGRINFDRMETFVSHVAMQEEAMLQAQLKTLLGRKGKRFGSPQKQTFKQRHRQKSGRHGEWIKVGKRTKKKGETMTQKMEADGRPSSTLEHKQSIDPHKAAFLHIIGIAEDDIVSQEEEEEEEEEEEVIVDDDEIDSDVEEEEILEEEELAEEEEKAEVDNYDDEASEKYGDDEFVEEYQDDDDNNNNNSEVEEEESEEDEEEKLEMLLSALKNDGESLDFEYWRQLYYSRKFRIDSKRDPEAESKKDHIVASYVEGLQWTYQYYYNGCVSWKWFYPYHYSPICSDLKNLKDIADRIEFSLDRPFSPFEQLLGVLPPRSSKLLPSALRPLVLSPNSPIRDFYPETFDIDREGTRYDYEGTSLLPFIDEDRLRAAMRSVDQSEFTERERKRNKFGTELLYEYVPPGSSPDFRPYRYASTIPGEMSDIFNCNIRETKFKASDIGPPSVRFVPRLCNGIRLGHRSPEGFPSLFSRRFHSAQLKTVGLTLFGHPSKKPSMCIRVLDPDDEQGEPVTVADWEHLLDKRVYIGYPFPRLATISSISDRTSSTFAEGTEDHEDEDSFNREAKRHQNALLKRYALDIGRVDVIVFVKLFDGMRKNRAGATVRSFTSEEFAFPIQLIADRYKPLMDPRFARQQPVPITDEFPVGTRVIPMKTALVGERCIVRGYSDDMTRLKISLEQQLPAGMIASSSGSENASQRDGMNDVHKSKVVQPPLQSIPMLIPQELKTYANRKYYPFPVAAKKIGISAINLGLVVGQWDVVDHHGKKVNIGLNLRDTRHDKRVIGYMKHDSSNQTLDETYFLNFNRRSSPVSQFSVEGEYRWEMSHMTINLVREYMQNFPELFEYMSQSSDPRLVHLVDVYGSKEKSEEELKKLISWLDAQEYRKLPFLPCNTVLLPDHLISRLEQNFIQATEEAAADEQRSAAPRKHSSITKTVMVVNPSSVYRPPDPFPRTLPWFRRDSYALGDQVVHLGDSGQVPLGLSGIIVGIEGTHATVVFPVEFVGGDTLNGRLQTFRGQSVPLESLLNLSALARYQQENATTRGAPSGRYAEGKTNPRENRVERKRGEDPQGMTTRPEASASRARAREQVSPPDRSSPERRQQRHQRRQRHQQQPLRQRGDGGEILLGHKQHRSDQTQSQTRTRSGQARSQQQHQRLKPQDGRGQRRRVVRGKMTEEEIIALIQKK